MADKRSLFTAMAILGLALMTFSGSFVGCADDDDNNDDDQSVDDDSSSPVDDDDAISDDDNDDNDDQTDDDNDDPVDDDDDNDNDDDDDDDDNDVSPPDYSECKDQPCPIVDFWKMTPDVLQVPLSSITENQQQALEFLRIRVDGVKVPMRIIDATVSEPVVFAYAPPIESDGYTAETHVIADLAEGDASPLIETRPAEATGAAAVEKIIRRHEIRLRDYWAIYHPPAVEGVFPDCWASNKVRLNEPADVLFEGFDADDRAVGAGFTLFGAAVFSRETAAVLNGAALATVAFSNYDTYEWEGDLTPVAPDANGAFTMEFSLVDNGSPADAFNVVSAYLDVLAPLSFDGTPYLFTCYETETVDVQLPGNYAGSIEIWDVTEPLAPQFVELVDDGTNLWLPGFTPGRTYAIFDPAQPPQPDGIFGVPDVEGVLSEEGDLIILAPETFQDELTELIALRESEGWTPVLRSPRELYHLFNNGYASPEAIRDYLDYAVQNWATLQPQALLLVGDSAPHLHFSNNYDIRLNLPTIYQWSEDNHLWFPSDLRYSFTPEPGEREVDDLLAVGRLPARTEAELTAAVSRQAAYQTATTDLYVYLSDDNDASFQYQAELTISELPAIYPVEALHLIDYNAIYPPAGGEPQWEEPAIIALRADLVALIQTGAGVIQYYGHGDMNHMAGETIIGQGSEWNNVEEMLDHQGQPPVLILFNCLSGYFAYTNVPHALSETMMLLEDADLGAAGVISPSSYGYPAHTADLSSALQDYFTNGEVQTVGAALIAAAKDLTDATSDEEYQVLTMSYNLLGDPCLPLILPTNQTGD